MKKKLKKTKTYVGGKLFRGFDDEMQVQKVGTDELKVTFMGLELGTVPGELNEHLTIELV